MRLPISLKVLVIGFALLILGGCNTTSSQDGWYYKGYFQNHPQTGSNEIAHAGTSCFFCKPDPSADKDGDGVVDSQDKCPTTPKNVKVDLSGCSLDSDGDGVLDHKDRCPNTFENVAVNVHGCDLDSDGDGVNDALDSCPESQANIEVDYKGCPLDSDGDGVIDSLDQCPGTAATVQVNSNGCSVDSDGDMVNDYIDRCPGTPAKAKVNAFGCWVVDNLKFRSGRSTISHSSSSALRDIVGMLLANPDLKIEVQGHTDNQGSSRLNTRLSQSRAQAVVDYLIGQGISPSRLLPKGYGPSQPIADNSTSIGRQENRRVELKPIR
ncbi:MAG: OmpA family protein [Magnetococcales bacterium]|nr:OmpA family protein [Magnetococcales bacterium]